MAVGKDRSRPGGPYVTVGLKKISDPSSDTVLHTQTHNETLINIYSKLHLYFYSRLRRYSTLLKLF